MQIGVWQVPKMWEGGEAWIIGGGPSLIDLFEIPSEIVRSVRSRQKSIEVYSPYLAALHSKHVIGINVAYQFGDWIDICFFGDKHFFLQHRGALSHFKKLVVTCSKKVGEKNLRWVKYLPIEILDHRQKAGISSNPNEVCWNKNSGAASISIAAWAGVKRIILVGFDMTFSTDNEQHFHNEYRQAGLKRKKKEIPFALHLTSWGEIKRDADAMGIEILNTSLNSAIKEIPKVHIKELL